MQDMGDTEKPKNKEMATKTSKYKKIKVLKNSTFYLIVKLY